MAIVRPIIKSDVEAVTKIYNHYVNHCVATFEETSISAGEMANRIATIERHKLPWLVIVEHEQVLGYAYAAPWKARSAYRYAVEVTVYLAPNVGGRGLGFQVYCALFEALKQLKVHNILAGISLPNEASVRLHEKMGMTKVAHFPEIGYKFGRWVDTGNWQLILSD